MSKEKRTLKGYFEKQWEKNNEFAHNEVEKPVFSLLTAPIWVPIGAVILTARTGHEAVKTAGNLGAAAVHAANGDKKEAKRKLGKAGKHFGRFSEPAVRTAMAPANIVVGAGKATYHGGKAVADYVSKPASPTIIIPNHDTEMPDFGSSTSRSSEELSKQVNRKPTKQEIKLKKFDEEIKTEKEAYEARRKKAADYKKRVEEKSKNAPQTSQVAKLEQEHKNSAEQTKVPMPGQKEVENARLQKATQILRGAEKKAKKDYKDGTMYNSGKLKVETSQGVKR